jgi:inner membrane protein
MDPVSQAALGAVVGRAAALGAVAGLLPDIDVLFAVGGDYFDQLVLHRGITHSLIFPPLAGPVLGGLAWWLERRYRSDRDPPGDKEQRLGAWVLVATLALLSHPLLDYLTPYGTQLLLPFSDARFAINAMPIIDPLYTLLLVTGLLVAGRWWQARARQVAVTTLLLSCAYLGYGAAVNQAAEREATRQLQTAGITDARVTAFPTILQIHYRRIVARTDSQDRVGFLSMWRPCVIDWSSAPRQPEIGPAVEAFLDTREGRIFDWFTMGWARYRLEPDPDGWRLHATDLRYGFTDDPNRSIFNASAPVSALGGLRGPVGVGRDARDATGQRLALLFRDTYAADCPLAGG